MLSSAASTLVRLAGWTYIPDLAAKALLNYYYQLFSNRGPAPQRGTARWINHYRIMFAVVVLGYLAYNLFEAARSTPPNFFEILGVPVNADESALKIAFRSFAKRNHPDRVGPAGADLFIHVRDAYEALKNPTTRFAYERFGPDVLTWRDCKTPKDYIRRGLTQASGFYIGTGGILILMSVAMGRSPVSFWRYLLLASLFASELWLALDYNSSSFLNYIFPNRVAFQNVLFLHQIFVFLSVAVSRVVPVLFPEPPVIRPEDPRTYAPFLERLSILAKAADREISRMLHVELHSAHGPGPSSSAAAYFSDVQPCVSTDPVMEALTNEMENMIVEHQLRADTPLRTLWDTVVSRQRDLAAKVSSRVRSTSPSDDEGVNDEEFVHDGHPGTDNTKYSLYYEAQSQKSPSSLASAGDGRLPSPPKSLSPETRFINLARPQNVNGRTVFEDDDEDDEDCRKDGVNLPSPRPSPPPSAIRSRSNSPNKGIQNRDRFLRE